MPEPSYWRLHWQARLGNPRDTAAPKAHAFKFREGPCEPESRRGRSVCTALVGLSPSQSPTRSHPGRSRVRDRRMSFKCRHVGRATDSGTYGARYPRGRALLASVTLSHGSRHDPPSRRRYCQLKVSQFQLASGSEVGLQFTPQRHSHSRVSLLVSNVPVTTSIYASGHSIQLSLQVGLVLHHHWKFHRHLPPRHWQWALAIRRGRQSGATLTRIHWYRVSAILPVARSPVLGRGPG